MSRSLGRSLLLPATGMASQDPLELAGDLLAVNYRFSQEHENIVVEPRVGYLDLLARGGPIYAVQFSSVSLQPIRSEFAGP